MYLAYNQCRDAEAFQRLTDSLVALLDSVRPARLVVDLRNNTGGDTRVIQPLLEAVRARSWINRRDALFVIMGRLTFSSGFAAAYEFRTRTSATLLGEPPAQRPNTFGNMRSFELPHSRMTVTYSTRWFDLVEGKSDTFEPDVRTPLTPAMIVNGTDPAMRWILASPKPAN
jgi:hypothetical protein